MVSELSELGANINALNDKGQTPLDLAVLGERNLAAGILALETPEYEGPTARQVLEELGGLKSGEL